MIQLKKKSKRSVNTNADYALEKFDKFYELLDLLTPKFDGKWNILLYDPKIVMMKELIESNKIPDWVDITIFTSAKKIEEISLQYPSMQPKDLTVRERFDIMVSQMKTLIAPDAAKVLLQMYRQNPDEVEDVLKRLDTDGSIDKITRHELSKNIVYTKRTYISDVMLAFINKDANRWNLYNKVHSELGTTICYYTMYKYARKLLSEKQAYLQNKDVSVFAVTRIDAATIDYIYILFSNSSNPNQLTAILYAIENRNKNMLNMFIGGR